MSLSRRKFMKVGAVAAAFTVFPLKSALGQNGSRGSGNAPGGPLSSTKLDQLNYYTESSFTPYVNTQFRVYTDTSSTRSLKLIEVDDYLDTLPQSALRVENSARTECFSLLMTTPPGGSFAQDTYLLEHEALGNFYLFLVPVSQQGKGPLDYYEAVIYRGPQYKQGSAPVGETNPGDNPFARQSATEGLTLENSAGGPKTEQDVFYFQPQKLKSKEPSVPKEEPGAAGRRAAAKLTLSQAPDISGLRLGMTVDEVLALFPGIRDDAKVRSSLALKPNRFGMQNLQIRPSKYSTNGKFEGISQIILTMLDGRVSTLDVIYKGGPVWGHVDEFVAKFSEENGLPGADSWDAYVGMDTQLKTLKCKEFEVSLFAGGENVSINYVQMRDTAALQRLNERRGKKSGAETS